jgi:hypothetical protein
MGRAVCGEGCDWVDPWIIGVVLVVAGLIIVAKLVTVVRHGRGYSFWRPDYEADDEDQRA